MVVLVLLGVEGVVVWGGRTVKLLFPTALRTRQIVWVWVRVCGGVEVWSASVGREARWAEVSFGILGWWFGLVWFGCGQCIRCCCCLFGLVSRLKCCFRFELCFSGVLCVWFRLKCWLEFAAMEENGSEGCQFSGPC